MVCYIIPVATAIIHYIIRKIKPSWGNGKHNSRLTLLLFGGVIFGVVDHLWNGELFLLGEKPMLDIMLGLTITLVILIAWATMVILDKTTVKNSAKTID